MSRLALYAAAFLYVLASVGSGVPLHMRLVLASYAVANAALARAV